MFHRRSVKAFDNLKLLHLEDDESIHYLYKKLQHDVTYYNRKKYFYFSCLQHFTDERVLYTHEEM